MKHQPQGVEAQEMCPAADFGFLCPRRHLAVSHPPPPGRKLSAADLSVLASLNGSLAFDSARLAWPAIMAELPARKQLLTVTTSRFASKEQLLTVNTLCNGTPAERKEAAALATELNLIWDKGCCLFRNLSLREIEALLSFPDGYVSSSSPPLSHAAALKMMGESFHFTSIFQQLYEQLPRISGHGRVNAVSMFCGLGIGPMALVQMHKMGLLTLGTLWCIELDEQRRAVFAAWFAAQKAEFACLAGVELLFAGDIVEVTDAAFSAMLTSMGGAHIIIGGSPCNNFSGSNRCPSAHLFSNAAAHTLARAGGRTA
jgi:site-specific DNA-cytosine methylase